MPLRETLQTILTDYTKAKSEPLEGHVLARFIRHDAEDAVQQALGELGAGLVVEGSPGQGNWAAVPWISVFDPAITTNATRGYYVVYLFHAHEPVVHLSLNQGTTAVREEFSTRTREVLRDRADLMRKRVADFGDDLSVNSIDLGSNGELPADYVAGHALGLTYDLAPCQAKRLCDLICKQWCVPIVL
jgi:5-methylcytosine-specific restriction protein A